MVVKMAKKNEIEVYDIGIGGQNAKSVIVSAVLETTGHVRFGDGTEVNLTITEKDLLPTLQKTDEGYKTDFIEKVVFAGSKRRGVDRRTIHLLRNSLLKDKIDLKLFSDFESKWKEWKNAGPQQKKKLRDELNKLVAKNTLLKYIVECYIPELCLECPCCWLYGATAMGRDVDYNIKTRVLYATAYSIEPSEIAVVTHSRNMVDEKTHTTAGEAGIHEEEFIRGGIHFPTITVLDHVVGWEIGMYAHALIENINQNKYTAASGRQGGMKFSEVDGNKLIVVDISPGGIFPLETIKVPADVTEYDKVVQNYKDATDLEKIKEMFESQGFGVEVSGDILEVKKEKSITISIDKDGVKKYEGDKGLISEIEPMLKEVKTLDQLETELKKIGFSIEKKEISELFVRKDTIMWKIKKGKDEISIAQIVNNNEKELMKRIFGNKAYGYLKEKQEEFKQFLETFDEKKWSSTHEAVLESLGIGTKKEEVIEEIEEEAS